MEVDHQYSAACQLGNVCTHRPNAVFQAVEEQLACPGSCALTWHTGDANTHHALQVADCPAEHHA